MKNKLEELINYSLLYDVDYSELFYEDSTTKMYTMNDSKFDNIDVTRINGVGIRLVKDGIIYYGSTSNLDDAKNVIDNLKSNFNLRSDKKEVILVQKEIMSNVSKEKDITDIEKKELLLNIDKLARKNSKITQVEAKIYEHNQNVVIANSNADYVEDFRPLTRLIISVVAKENDNVSRSYQTYGASSGYELLDTINLEEEVNNLVESAITKLSAINSPGGVMPVIIGPAFGAVIFHEACGHAMEATTVARGISVLSNKLNTKIASDKVTIIDDGTIKNGWGSVNVDDEGNLPRKNVLIENGYLKGYLIDYINSFKMNMDYTGSGRRENYKYAPTSRMNNTYLLEGTDSIDGMIKSIKYGLYAKDMGGGSVDPITGDFNFAVNEAYLIEDGKITKPVKDASLIGNMALIAAVADIVGG